MSDELRELQDQLSSFEQDARERPTEAPAEPYLMMCPGCGEDITIEHTHEGIKVECSLCGRKFKASVKADGKRRAAAKLEAEERIAREQAQREREDHLEQQARLLQLEEEKRLEEAMGDTEGEPHAPVLAPSYTATKFVSALFIMLGGLAWVSCLFIAVLSIAVLFQMEEPTWGAVLAEFLTLAWVFGSGLHCLAVGLTMRCLRDVAINTWHNKDEP